MDVAAVIEREWQLLDCVADDLPGSWLAQEPLPEPLVLGDAQWPSCLPADPFAVDPFAVDPFAVDPFVVNPLAVELFADEAGVAGGPADEPGVAGDAGAAVQSLHAEAARLPQALAGHVRGLADSELTDWVHQLEQASACLAAADQVLLAELDRRGTALDWGYPSVARFLTGQLRVRPAVAAARMNSARGMGPRTSLTGQVLPPHREQVAAAQAAGLISADHARVIDHALTRLPAGVPVSEIERVEAILVDLATRADPTVVARAGRHALALLDPDGQPPRDDDLDRHRGLVLRAADDGTGHLTGTLTPELLAALQTVLSPLAAPHPADDTGVDARTPPQRLHDALADACQRLLHSGTLPDSGGVPATIIVTITEPQLRQRVGLATTTFGTTIPITRLLHYAAECDYIPVVLNNTSGILAYGRTRRVATEGQTKALIARDHGCTLPGCHTPAQWCQRHHITAHADGGPTNLNNLTLVCGYHHRSFGKHGWECVMINSRPHWKPPPHLDPHQTPRRNTHWDPVLTIDPPHIDNPTRHPTAYGRPKAR